MAQRPPNLTDRRKAAQTNSTGAMRWRFQGVECALDMQHLGWRWSASCSSRPTSPRRRPAGAHRRRPFSLAALTYLARRQAGERITYAMLEADALDRQLQAMAAAGERHDLEWLGDDDDRQETMRAPHPRANRPHSAAAALHYFGIRPWGSTGSPGRGADPGRPDTEAAPDWRGWRWWR